MPLITGQFSPFRPPPLPEKGTWIYLNSQGVEAIRFILTDAVNKVGTLRVSFKRKPAANPRKPVAERPVAYDYIAVPEALYMELIASPTPMKFVNDVIKPKFAFKPIMEADAARENAEAASKNIEFDIDGAVGDIEIPDKDEIVLDSAADGRVVTAQLDRTDWAGDDPVEGPPKRLKRFFTEHPGGGTYHFGELTFTIEMDRSQSNARDQRTTLSIRRDHATPDVQPHIEDRHYAKWWTAINAAQKTLDGWIRVNTVPVANALESYREAGGKRSIGDHDYFVSKGSGDLYYIERRPAGAHPPPNAAGYLTGIGNEDAELLRAFAFTNREDAVSQLCHNPLFSDSGSMSQDLFVSPLHRSRDGDTPYAYDDGRSLDEARLLANRLGITGNVFTGRSLLAMGFEEANRLTLSMAVMEDLLPDDILIVQDHEAQSHVDAIPPSFDRRLLDRLELLGWTMLRRDLRVLQFRHRNADPNRPFPPVAEGRSQFPNAPQNRKPPEKKSKDVVDFGDFEIELPSDEEMVFPGEDTF